MGKENAFYIDDNPDPTAIYDNNKFNPLISITANLVESQF